MPQDFITTSPETAVHSAFPRVTGTTVSTKHGLDVNIIGGSITVNVGGSPLADINWDALDVQQTSATVDTFLFYSGGLAGSLVATCTVTYTDSTKENLNTVVWS